MSSIIFQKVRISMFMDISCYQNVFRKVFYYGQEFAIKEITPVSTHC